jgi:hypothetical protein
MYKYLILKYLYRIENEIHNAASVKVATALLFSKSDFKSFKGHVTVLYLKRILTIFGAITWESANYLKLRLI